MSDEKKISELEKKIRQLERENAALTVRAELQPMAWAAGVRAEALDDVLNRAERNFNVGENRKLTAKDSGYGPDQWIKELRKTASHLFTEAGTGSGNEPEERSRLPREFTGLNNPWSKQSWNLTRQGQVFQLHGEAVAERLAELAGVKFGAVKPAE